MKTEMLGAWSNTCTLCKEQDPGEGESHMKRPEMLISKFKLNLN